MGIFDAAVDILSGIGDVAVKVAPIIQDFRNQELSRDLAKLRARQPQIFQLPRQPSQFPGQFAQTTLPQGFGGSFMAAPFVTQAGLLDPLERRLPDVPGVDLGPQGSARLFSPFLPTMAGARAQTFIAVNPISQALTWFKPAGRPILWSGDLSACKRVKRVAARARRSSR